MIAETDLQIRRARRSDVPAIERFIGSAYDQLAPFKGPDRWRWQFVNNPFLRDESAALPVWIALDGELIVGQIAVQATEVQLAGHVADAGWVVDVMILPAYRGQGLGHRMHDAVTREVDILLTLTMAPATRRMAERGGAITLGPTRQFSRWVCIRPDDVRRFLVQRLENRPGLARLVRLACGYLAFHWIIAALIYPVTAARELTTAHNRISHDIVEVKRFGDDADELWRRASVDYPAACPRSSRFLNWRFTQCPQLRYRLFMAFRDGKAVGYSVLRRTTKDELRQGVIVDLFAARNDRAAFRDLIQHAIDLFGETVATVECGTSVPEIEGDLRRSGFIRSRTLAPTAVLADDDIRRRVASLKDDWLFSKGDHDWDQIHLG